MWILNVQIQRHLSSTSSEDSCRSFSGSCTPPTAKEYVLSLHQNSRSVLLYGKNNVSVQPVGSTDMMLTNVRSSANTCKLAIRNFEDQNYLSSLVVCLTVNIIIYYELFNIY